MINEVTVIIPAIPSESRMKMLAKAIESVQRQDWDGRIYVDVLFDVDNEGPAPLRNWGVERATTQFVAFLDDDDWLLPHHIRTLVQAQDEYDADLVWPWFQVVGGTDPFPGHRGRQWNPADAHQFPITVLADRQKILSVGGFNTVGEGEFDKHGNRAGEDWRLWLAMSEIGAEFHHVNEITWIWRHHSNNTSGLPSRR